MVIVSARQSGFTYLGLLFVIAILGITLASVGVVWSTQIRRDKEAELLWIGNQYRMAIGQYYATGGQFPMALADLIEDKRFPQVRRYLRRLYPDPMTGQVDWQLINAPSMGIMGIASSSQAKPIKVAGFDPPDASFKDATCYCDWKFTYAWRALHAPRPAAPAGAN
jgi:type II secretory pathway pseudopilin PulG